MLRVGVKQKSRAARPCALYSGIVLTWAAKTERETVPLTPQIFHFENSGRNTTEFLTLRFSKHRVKVRLRLSRSSLLFPFAITTLDAAAWSSLAGSFAFAVTVHHNDASSS